MAQISVINIRADRTKGNAGKSFVLQWFGSNYWLRAEATKKGQAAGGVSPKRKLSMLSLVQVILSCLSWLKTALTPLREARPDLWGFVLSRRPP